MPARTEKTPIVLVYDPTDGGRFAVYDEGTLLIEVSDENAHYCGFVEFCQKFNIPYEERDMPKDLGGEEFPYELENLEPRRWRLVSSTRAKPGRDFALYVDNYLYCIGNKGLEAVLLEMKVPFTNEMTEREKFPEFFEDLLHKTDLDIDCLATDEAAFLRLDGHYYTRRQAEHIYNALKAHF